jgi:hypothetical protein
MQRRTLLQLLATLPIPALRAWAQTAAFPGRYESVLREIGAIVLPGELDRAGTDRVVERFERYVREYRPGADMDHGYGDIRLRVKPAALAPAYLTQLASIRAPIDSKTIEEALRQAGVNDLPRFPEGKHVAADLMSYYFHSSDANDLCYRAAIGRDQCRGLDGSDQPPAPLKGAL